VFIHKEITDNSKSQSVLMGMPNAGFTAGQTYSDSRITVRINSISAGVAKPTVTY
jgi:hypothetical protein